MTDFVPPERWGKDHHDLLMYLEVRLVDHDGRIDYRNMRGHITGQAYRYPTRLKDGEELENHNDFDCLRDLIHFGYVTADNPSGRFTFRDTNGSVRELGWKVNALSWKGWQMVHTLRRQKAERNL